MNILFIKRVFTQSSLCCADIKAVGIPLLLANDKAILIESEDSLVDKKIQVKVFS